MQDELTINPLQGNGNWERYPQGNMISQIKYLNYGQRKKEVSIRY